MGGLLVQRRFNDRFEQRYFGAICRIHHQYPYASRWAPSPFGARSNPIPWINAWLVSDNVQVAPQEVEVSSYLVGQIDSKVDTNDFGDFDL